MTIVTNTCLSLLFLQLSLRSVVSQEVLLHPYSRLVPVGTDVYFICKLRNVQYPYWMVNNIEVNANFQKNYLSARGIYILDNELDNGITTLTLRVNSSYSTINNTRVACRADGIRSTTAKLLTIDRKPKDYNFIKYIRHCTYDTIISHIVPLDSPLSQNPSLRQKNSTALLLQWSSPYIWPGYSVGLYNISIRNHGNDHVIYHQISAEFDDKIIDFTFVQEEQETNCSEFTFGVSAVSTDSQELSTAYVTGGFASGNPIFKSIAIIICLTHSLFLQIYMELT